MVRGETGLDRQRADRQHVDGFGQIQQTLLLVPLLANTLHTLKIDLVCVHVPAGGGVSEV